MGLSLESLQKSGGFVGAPVKRQLEWPPGSGQQHDVYVRRLGYTTAVEDLKSLSSKGDVGAHRIALCIVDDQGEPIFPLHTIRGQNEDGTPATYTNDDGEEVPLGEMSDELTVALLGLIGEVNDLGKKKGGNSKKSRKSGTS